MSLSPLKIIGAWIALIFSAAAPPLLLFTVPYFIYVMVSLIRGIRYGRRSARYFVEYESAVQLGRAWKSAGGSK